MFFFFLLFTLFKGNLFFLAVSSTHSFKSPRGLLSFKELPAFTYIVLQCDFDLLFNCLTVAIEPLINMSKTLILSVAITFGPTHNFNLSGRLVVWERSLLSGIGVDMYLFLYLCYYLGSWKEQLGLYLTSTGFIFLPY